MIRGIVLILSLTFGIIGFFAFIEWFASITEFMAGYVFMGIVVVGGFFALRATLRMMK